MKVQCPSCNEIYELPKEYYRRRVRCRFCKFEYRIDANLLVGEDLSFWQGAMTKAETDYGHFQDFADPNTPPRDSGDEEIPTIEPIIEP